MRGPDTTQLQAALEHLPRVPLATLPTPLQEAPRLGEAIGVSRLLVKRDDLTGLAFGGNKVRQMEFIIGAARAAGADMLIAGGSYDQSNHARVAAAAARAAGMRSLIVVRPGGRHPGPQGNGLLTRLLADEFVVMDELAEAPAGRLEEVAYRETLFQRLASERRREGATPYVLAGTSLPIGAIGYVAACLELLEQTQSLGLDRPVVAVTSAGATQAGLEVANRLLGEPFRIIGLAYLPTAGAGPGWVAELAAGASDLLGLPLQVDAGSIVNHDDVAGPAYGVLNEERREAMRLTLQTEGLLLDPVYTATGLAGLRHWAGSADHAADDEVIFIHTGGLPALFSYADDIISESEH